MVCWTLAVSLLETFSYVRVWGLGGYHFDEHLESNIKTLAFNDEANPDGDELDLSTKQAPSEPQAGFLSAARRTASSRAFSEEHTS